MAAIDWEAVARRTLHPLRVRILELVAKAPDRVSPTEISDALKEPLGNVAYHVRRLEADGLLVKAGTVARRGAMQHYYRPAKRLLR